MPVPDQRDPEVTRDLLTRWLSRHLPGVRIPMLETPKTTGFSSETLIFDAEWDDRREAFVARVAPIQFQIFPEPRFALEEAVRVWPDEAREPEYLGRPEYRPDYVEGTREVATATISFSPPAGKPFDVHATPILPVHMMVGTGYGLESDWRHGMYHGPDLVVQGVSYDTRDRDHADRMWGMVDAVARFEYEGNVGFGLFEYWALGPHPSFEQSA